MKNNQKKLDGALSQKDFPIFARKINGKRLVYLDSASTSQKPRQVIDTMRRYYHNHNANIHRGAYTISEEATMLYESAHQKIADFIGGKAQEVVFTRNTTEAINLVMYSYGLEQVHAGDNIVTTIMEHHSNFVPWQQLCKKKNAELRVVNVRKDGTLDMEQLSRMVDKKTKIVAVTHMSNVLGTINDVEAIAEITHNKGGIILVDGAQSVPHMPIDVRKLDCDFLAFSGHKMLGPTGIGVLYGKEHLLKNMEPFLFGGDMIRQVTVEKTTWNDLPWKFEAGTPNIAGGIGLAAAIDCLNKLGMDNVAAHEKKLLDYGMNVLGSMKDVIIDGTAPQRGGIVSFNLENIHPHDLATVCSSENVCIRAGHHCCQPLMERLGVPATARASFYVYNTKEDIDALREAIRKARKALR